MSEELNILDITSSDLENWSKTIHARGQLPQLIRMLVLETNPNVSKCHMPYGEDIGRPGCDGEVISSCEVRNVPYGVSYWEMGTNEEPRKKAEDDYNKRRGKVDPLEAKNITFVFVTPKNWVKGKDWAQKKEEDRFWKNVCVIDACNLSCWINEHPVVKLWFSRVIGKLVKGFRHLEWAWDEWRNACSPPLPSILFELELRSYKEKFLEWLNQQEEHYIDINAESKEEAFAFIYELFKLDEFDKYRNKVIIVDGQDSIEILVQLIYKGAIPIIHDYQTGKRLCTNSPGTHIIRICLHPYENQARYVITLGLLSLECIDEVVRMYESNKLKRNDIILNSYYSRTVLRRLISSNPDIREPEWINNEKIDMELIVPLLFCGYWQLINKEDSTHCVNEVFIRALYGKNEDNLEDVYDELIDIAKLPDSPIWYSCFDSCAYVSIKSREEYIRLLIKKNCIKRKHWERFRNAAIEVFRTVREQVNSCFSLSPRFYILRTCILIDVNSNALFKGTIHKPTKIRNAISEELFSLSIQTFFADNGRFLTLIAESWPDEYLSYLSNAIQHDVNFKEIISTRSWELVQSITFLAIHPNYYEQAIRLLSNLYLLLHDRQMKEPIYNLFCSWYPQTNASSQSINKAADELAKTNSELAWYVGARQFKQGGDWVSVNASGTLRGGSWQVPEKPRSEKTISIIREKWENILKTWDHVTSDTIIEHINIVDSFSEENQKKSWIAISEGIKRLPDCEKIACHMAIRSRLRLLQKKSFFTTPADFINYKIQVNSCIQKTHLQDPYLSNSWCFLYETQRLFIHGDRMGWPDKCAVRLGRKVIKKMLSEGNNNFWELNISDKFDCNILGRSLTLELSIEQVVDFIVSCVQNETVGKDRKRAVVDAITRNICLDQYPIVCAKLHDKLGVESSAFFDLLLMLRWSPFLQTYIDKLLLERRLTYWREVKVVCLGEYSEAKDRAVLGLLSVGRADDALNAMFHSLGKKDICANEKRLLIHIMEKLCRLRYRCRNVSFEIEQSLDVLENCGVSLEKLVHWELHFFAYHSSPETLSKRLSRWIWSNPYYAVRLFKLYMALSSEDNGGKMLKFLRFLRLSKFMIYNIPREFSFESWIGDVEKYTAQYVLKGEIRYLCLYLMGYTRKVSDITWPSEDLCKAIHSILDSENSNAFIWGVESTFDDLIRTTKTIQVLESQASAIESSYPIIADSIRCVASSCSENFDTEVKEREILKRLGG